MDPAGFWAEPDPGSYPKYRGAVWSVILLAQLGASIGEDKRVGRACAYVLEYTLAAGGQFSTTSTASETPIAFTATSVGRWWSWVVPTWGW